MERKKRKAHWSSVYLKRINSTEVTVKRERSRTEEENKPEKISTDPVFLRLEETKPGERTPDRVVYSPARKPTYITPNRNVVIPQTPNSLPSETHVSTRSKKRLF